MITKATVLSDAAASAVAAAVPVCLWPTPPWTTEERLKRIEAMTQRINGYVEFMRQISNLNGSSAEAKDKAVAAFYERMVALERQLGRIQEDLRLG